MLEVGRLGMGGICPQDGTLLFPDNVWASLVLVSIHLKPLSVLGLFLMGFCP